MRLHPAIPLAAIAAFFATPAQADEVFAGAYVHAVETPFTFETGESGVDAVIGYRFDRIEALSFVGKPAPYVLGSVNSDGDTNFAAVGLSWKVDLGPAYVRPGVGIAVHDGPKRRVGPDGFRTDLGSRVVFEPEIAIGTRVSERVSVEASWMHVSHARIFDSGQNPGIDMMGLRLNLAL